MESENNASLFRPLSQTIKTESSPYRWFILFQFSLLAFSNAIIWISFAPISTYTQEFYSVSTSIEIDLLSLLFMITYLPGSVVCTYVFHKYGLQRGVWVGAVLNALAALCRYFSAFNGVPKYAIVVIGQTLGGMAQPFFTNSCAKLAGDWFPSNERNICTTISSMSNPIGIAVGQLLPTLIVFGDNQNEFSALLLYEMIICVVPCILAILFFRKHPKHPPSIAASNRNMLKELRANADDDNEGEAGFSFASMHYLKDSIALFSNFEFVKLLIGFGLGLGMFNGVSTLILQYVKPTGYGTDDAGIFGGLIIGGGLVGAGIVGAILDATQAYRIILKVMVTGTFLSSVFLLFVLKPDAFAPVAAAFGCMGFMIIPLLPSSFESAVECTYPISEETSSTMLMLFGNLFGIVMVFALEPLIQMQPSFETIWNPASISILVISFICLIFFWSFNGEYHRLLAEAQHVQSSSERIDGELVSNEY